MWGSLNSKDFETKPELIECKKFFTETEEVLRSKESAEETFSEMKNIIVGRLQTQGNPKINKSNGFVETRTYYFLENNPFVTATIIKKESEIPGKNVTEEAIHLTSGRSDAFEFEATKNAFGEFKFIFD